MAELLKRFVAYYRPHRRLFLLDFGSAVAAGLLELAFPVVVTLFGGVTSIWGPVIGAAILVPLAESLNAELGNIIPGIQGVVYGAAIIAIILAAPDGLYWTIRDRWFRRALPERWP